MVRRGSILFELLVAMMILGLLAASVAAIYRAHARAVLMLYEERVAWEAAAARVVNDPAAPPASVRRVYKRRQLYSTWIERSSGVAYLFRPAQGKLPP